MIMKDRIVKIRNTVEDFFNKNPKLDIIPAKDLMPEFVKAGIYTKYHRKGLPIRKDLRELDKSGELNRIPHVLPIRKNKNTNWYFIRKTADRAKLEQELSESQKKSSVTEKKHKSGESKKSDEDYILDLCDEVLGMKGSRQHRFDFLRGDLHSDGKSRTRLPCDIYYPELNLVIEYNERQHTEGVDHFDKPGKLTVSGVHRGEQRKRYDRRRRKVLPEHGIRVIDFHYYDFEHTSSKRLIRNKTRDILAVRERLGEIVKTE